MGMRIKQLVSKYLGSKTKLEQDPTIPLDQLLWMLEGCCVMQSIPFDKKLAHQQFSGTSTLNKFVQVGQDLNLKTKMVSKEKVLNKNKDQLGICFIKNDSVDDEYSPAFIYHVKEDEIIVHRFGKEKPEALSILQFSNSVASVFMLVSRIWTKNDKKPVSFGYSWLWQEMLKHKRVWNEILIASLVIQAISLLTPLMTQTVIDKVITNHAQSTLMVLGIGLVVFMLFSVCLSWARQYLVLHTGNRIDAILGSQVFVHLTRLAMPYFETRSTGALVTRLHGVDTIREFITGTFVTLVLDLPFMLIFFGIMVYYSPSLSVITVSIAILMGGISFLIAPFLREKSNDQFMAGSIVQSFSTEYISGMETVKSLQMENIVEAKYSQHMAEYMNKGFDAKRLANTYNSVMSALDQISSLSVLGIGAWIAMQDSGFSIGMLVAFQMISGKVTQPLLRMSGLWQQFQQANIALARLGDIMNVPPEKFSMLPSSSRKNANSLEIKDLSFSYRPDLKPLYENLSFSIQAGQCVAIVGPSGCGKSTIAKLLQGFYPSYGGQINVGGRELRTVAVNELRTWFGVVPQETTLFSGSIVDNLHAANPMATMDQMVNVCKMAGVHEAIEKLSKGYLMEIGERGVGLSGGQKQRLAIARALLKGAGILVFDESTANLDPHSAQAVADTINSLKGQVTILFVAHHMPPNLKVDRVIKLPEGTDIPLNNQNKGASSSLLVSKLPSSSQSIGKV